MMHGMGVGKSEMKKVSILCPCFKGERYLAAFLENMSQQTIFHECEVVLDHNEPSERELKIVADFERRFPDALVHQIVRPVVPVSASINNCIRAASGIYLCIGNVDDHRTPDSLERMCSTLDVNPDAGFTYGDFVIVDGLGKREGRFVHCPEFERNQFTRGFFLGPFFMWRADLVSKVGYWDEQLRSGSDFDFVVRLAYSCMGKKTWGNLGFYLNTGEGASRGAKHLPRNIQPVERTVIELRYGAYDKTEFLDGYQYVRQARRYRLDHLLINGEWQPVERYVPNYRQMMAEREPERLAFERNYRRWLLQHYATMPARMLRNGGRSAARWVLQALGLLDTARTWRDGGSLRREGRR